MRKIATVAALVAVVGGSLLMPSPSGAAVVGVEVGDSTFGPATITVTAGDTVTWTVSSDMPHTVTADGGAFDSGTLTDGQTFSFTFQDPGTYSYYCFFHGGPGGVGMSGSVVVEAAVVDPTTPPPGSPAAEAQGGGETTGGSASPTTSMPRSPQTGTSSPLYTG